MKRRIYLILLTAFVTTQVLSQQKNINQPIVINKFTIYENNNQLLINWSTDGNSATNVWKVQRSADKIQFSTIALVLGNDPGQPGDNYAYKMKIKDAKDIKFYYRLCHIDVNGKELFSDILTPAK